MLRLVVATWCCFPASRGGVLESGGGDIQVKQSGGDLKISTGGGNIDVDNVAGPIEVETGGGSIRIGSSKGSVRAETGSGRIELNGILQCARKPDREEFGALRGLVRRPCGFHA